MFSFYALPALPFLILAVVYVLGAIMTPPTGIAAGTGRTDRQLIGTVVAGVYVLLVALCFAYFYPIFVGQLMPVRRLVGPHVAGQPLDLTGDAGPEPRPASGAGANGPPPAVIGEAATRPGKPARNAGGNRQAPRSPATGEAGDRGAQGEA